MIALRASFYSVDARMKIMIFGLTISSSWGNGHATLWRGLCKALGSMGHDVTFFERDVSYYAQNRDCCSPAGCSLFLYDSWQAARARIARELADADVVIVTSYCPDALCATRESLDAGRPICVFYDLDTPVTLSRLRDGETVPYIGTDGLRHYDLVLSYTGGEALTQLRSSLGARRAHALYGHVDPDVHRPAVPIERYRADLSYLGTYAADRQARLVELFVEPARRRSAQRFLLAGTQYPEDFPWLRNVYFVRHLSPDQHAAFFSSSRLTLNITRAAMAQMGWCPSGRLFEASACGATVVSDRWAGLDDFYTPGAQILLADDTVESLQSLDLDAARVRSIGRAARERTLDEHTSHSRARVLVRLLESACSSSEAELMQ